MHFIKQYSPLLQKICSCLSGVTGKVDLAREVITKMLGSLHSGQQVSIQQNIFHRTSNLPSREEQTLGLTLGRVRICAE